jgi:AcrR family transcriptional regulator
MPPLLEKALGPAAATSDETAERILAGALSQFEDFGIRRSTMEDVARRAGVSRITVYRRFPQKERLIEAVVLREVQDFFAQIEAAVKPLDSVEDRIVEGFAFTLAAARGHGLLTRLLRTEPETLLPHLTVQGGPLIAAGRAFLANQMRIAHSEVAPEDLDVVAELVGRLVLSFLLTPDSVAAVESPRKAREFAHRWIAPLMMGQS